MDHQASLSRYLLQETHTRAVFFDAKELTQYAIDLHQLQGDTAECFAETLIAAALLLNLNKGGIRQVLQCDQHNSKKRPLKRLLAEACDGRLRGYVQCTSGPVLLANDATALGNTLGKPILLSTVRDLGVGQPYVSTIEAESDYLADALVHYLQTSVQIRADLLLSAHRGLLLEAMPGCSDAHWFRSLDALASCSTELFQTGSKDDIMQCFSELQIKALQEQTWNYRCHCSAQKLAESLQSLSEQQRIELSDADGKISLSCEYCRTEYRI